MLRRKTHDAWSTAHVADAHRGERTVYLEAPVREERGSQRVLAASRRDLQAPELELLTILGILRGVELVAALLAAGDAALDRGQNAWRKDLVARAHERAFAPAFVVARLFSP